MRHVKARIEHLLRTEGIRALPAAVGRHLFFSPMRSLFCVERYVVYQFDTDTRAAPVRRPDFEGLEVVALERDEDVRHLAERGFEVLDYHPAFRGDWLRDGRVAFCAYVNGELAHIAWVVLSADARGDWLPYRVDFEHGEACWGGSYTWPRFRNRGIYAYVCGIRLKYMHEHGFPVCRDAVRVDNIASLKGQGWWHPRPCLTGRFVRFLKWTSWREQPWKGALT